MWGPIGELPREAALLSLGTSLYKQQLHLGTYYWSKLQFDILLLFTSALITGWGKEHLRFAKNFGDFLKSSFLSFQLFNSVGKGKKNAFGTELTAELPGLGAIGDKELHI